MPACTRPGVDVPRQTHDCDAAAFAHDAVQALEGGRVHVLFKAPWRSGVTHADMTPNKSLGSRRPATPCRSS